MLKAREGIHYGRGEDRSIDALRTKFEDYCPVQNIPYEENPFFTCVEKAGLYPATQIIIHMLTHTQRGKKYFDILLELNNKYPSVEIFC